MICRLLAVLLLAAGSARAAETASFLKLSAGPRPIGLGEAFTGLADDLNAQNLNPGGLAQLSHRELGLSHAELYGDTKLDALGYAHPLSAGRGTLAAGFLRLSHGAIGGRDEQGNPSGSINASDTAFQVAYGRLLPGLGMLGVNAKYLESKLAYATARGYALDLGLLRRGKGAWSWGAAVQNLGSGLKFQDRTDPLPTAIAAGAAVRLAGSFTVSGEVRQRLHGGGTSAGIGTEFGLLSSLVLRGGYRSSMQGGGQSAPGGFAPNGLGMGFGVRMKKASFDYAFSPQGELGQSQRLSVSTRW